MANLKQKLVPLQPAFDPRYRPHGSNTCALFVELMSEARSLASDIHFYRPLGWQPERTQAGAPHFEVVDGKRITHWFLQDRFFRNLELQLDIRLTEVEELERKDINGIPMPTLKFQFINTYTLARFLYACLCFDQDSHPASPYFNGAKVLAN